MRFMFTARFAQCCSFVFCYRGLRIRNFDGNGWCCGGGFGRGSGISSVHASTRANPHMRSAGYAHMRMYIHM